MNYFKKISLFTLKGFHFKRKPFSEDKILSCIKGEICDIAVDLRSKSKTYKKWISFRLNEKNKYLLLVPKGCANAFLTLKDNTLIHCYSSQYYNSNPKAAFIIMILISLLNGQKKLR